MKEKIEFYNSPDGSIHIRTENELRLFDMSCKDIINMILVKIQDLYPTAYLMLSGLYRESACNQEFFRFKIVHRFIRCNFGEFDALHFDLDGESGTMHLEDVKCPMRGECAMEGMVCRPKMNTTVSEREREVATLIAKGLTRQQVADTLYISVHTVSRHIDNIKSRLHLKSTAQIISMFHE